jgi:DNA mismatch endonuclease, patch repair protein
MSDVFTQAKRSEVMSRIRSTGNKDTEQKLAGLMRAAGITGWRRQVKLRVKTWRGEKSRGGQEEGAKVNAGKALQVRPDFVFRAQRVAVFVDGCFWHGCPRHATRPRQNRAFWDAKLARNKARDRAVTRGLKRAGWTVLRIWECALVKSRQAATLRRIERVILPT